MKLKFIHPSEQELIDAYQFYEEQLTGLGNQFINEFNNTIKVILNHPTLWKKVGEKTRRALIKRFSYLILYIYKEETIHITCIAHQHRNPSYYVERLT
ncbi:MAG: type II toxin-antitoxin system RelE/ParE family toxin [Melioribacteraceae bacterium]